MATEDISSIWEEDATKLTKNLRLFFIFLFSFILLFAVIGNLAAIRLALNRKHRLLYKCCVISLATSDALMAISTCSYSLSAFSHPWVNWIMGEFMCKFIPFVQTVTILSNSFTLSSIAMDRYQGVVNAIQGRWNPSLNACLGVIATIWTVAGVASIPMILEYYIEYMYVLKPDEKHHLVSSFTLAEFCTVGSKQRMSIYISLLFALIFLPLLFTFLTLYGMIGWYIWMRRPMTGRSRPGECEAVAMRSEGRGGKCGAEDGGEVTPESTSAAAATTTVTSVSSPSPFSTSHQTHPRAQTALPYHPHGSSRVSHTERRKKRILKIIFALMLTFFVTRLPIWCFTMVTSNVTLVGKKWWILQYSLSALSLLGTVLNPFLYGFLQEGRARRKRVSFLPSFFICPFWRVSRRVGVRNQHSCPHRRPQPGNYVPPRVFVRAYTSDDDEPQVKPWSIT